MLACTVLAHETVKKIKSFLFFFKRDCDTKYNLTSCLVFQVHYVYEDLLFLLYPLSLFCVFCHSRPLSLYISLSPFSALFLSVFLVFCFVLFCFCSSSNFLANGWISGVFEVSTAMRKKTFRVFVDVGCSILVLAQRFGEPQCLHFNGWRNKFPWQ